MTNIRIKPLQVPLGRLRTIKIVRSVINGRSRTLHYLLTAIIFPYLNYFKQHSPTEVDCFSACVEILRLMQHESSLLCSQEPAAGRWPFEFSPQPEILLL